MKKNLIIGYRRKHKRVEISKIERAIHMLILGGSGRGKSVLNERMIRQDILAGRGVCLIDPHGSLCDAVLSWLAFHELKNRRVILVEPNNTKWTGGFNPLAYPFEALTAGVESVTAAFGQVWGGEDFAEKPRLRRVLTALLYLLAEHQLTLSDAVLVMADEQKPLRRKLGAALQNPYFRSEWDTFNAMSEREWREYSESTMSRFGPFLASDTIRAMVGQREAVLDLGAAMENGDVVLVNLARSERFSSTDAQLLGSLIVNDLTQRALLRTPGARPFYLYIDEAARFLNSDIEVVLDQTRKFGLHLIASLQRLGALREKGESIYNAMMSIQNKVIFGGMVEDDARLVAQDLFSGEFDLQRTKDKLTSPVVIGHIPEWLSSESESESDSDSEGWSEGESETESVGTGISTSTNILVGEDGLTPIAMGEAAAESEQTGRASGRFTTTSRASVVTRGRTHGTHQTYRPIIEERASQTYSLEELTYLAAARLKNLSVGQAVVKISGHPVQQFTVPLPTAGARAAITLRYRERLLTQSAHAEHTETALSTQEKRRRETAEAMRCASSTAFAADEEKFASVEKPRRVNPNE